MTEARAGTPWRSVGNSAIAQVVVTGLSGLVGMMTARLIIEQFGVAQYAQYGLLSSLPALIPFADLGMAAVVVNVLASSDRASTDPVVRRTLTSAFRVLVCSGLTIAAIGVLLGVLGWWPVLLGPGLLDGGAVTATVCAVILGLALPCGVGARILVGLGRNPLQTALSGLAAPLVMVGVLIVLAVGNGSGSSLAIASYAAVAIVAVVRLVAAARLVRPQVGAALRDVPRLRAVPGVRVFDVAWPMLVQMISLPIAMQTGRILLSHQGTSVDLAQYNLAAQLFGVVLAAVSSAGLTLWPHFARARNQSVKASPFRASLVFVAAGAVLSLLLAVLLPVLVPLVTDGKLGLTLSLVAAFVAFTIVQAAKYPIGMYMTDTAGLRAQVLPIVLMVPLNLALTWWSIPYLGAAGPVWATAASVVVCQVVPTTLWVRRRLRQQG
ncbi:Membrane protein involved in the export of O-antigen and teichoic acid [Promicromonospora umidemergens]|uniref:Oligosaccharide flippase family protein n=1 Tax=Promicromonospora umidemergens TaxID=629679 RepID=A0ABP8Y4H4_9MICO|nr:polysaccharide biosynthesis protein [Promicromonospora umidemergens]MCP2282576.1 Membrane protein involved in the export of O-antigen and teichoic acid [Promicromonospora umidemergens]